VLRNFPWGRLQVLSVPAGRSNCADLSPQPPLLAALLR
jgi:hypothetical protein